MLAKRLPLAYPKSKYTHLLQNNTMQADDTMIIEK